MHGKSKTVLEQQPKHFLWSLNRGVATITLNRPERKNPLTYESQLVPRQCVTWHGDVWKAYVEFKQIHPAFDCYVVDTDCGCGVIVNNEDKTQIPINLDLNYKYLDENRKELLNLISVEEFKNIFK